MAFKHPFNDERCARRLLWEYQNYDHLIVGVDFDNTIRPVKPDSSCEEVIELLRRCSKDPKITLCLWSVQAGLTPAEKAEWEYKTAVGIAEALAQSNVRWVPEIIMTGQGSSSSAMDAVGFNMMLDVVNKVNGKK